MVGAFHRGLLTLLHHMHRSTDATRRTPATRRRSMYRYMRKHRPRVYPNIAYTSLGLRHEHLFITNPDANCERLPYAIDTAWAASTPGERTLYLHCLVPNNQQEAFRHHLEGLTCKSIERISTGDAWQYLAALTRAIDEHGRATGMYDHDASTPPPSPPTTLADEHPLLIPVATTVHGGRRNADDAWTAIYARLGERVWKWLPRHTPRWRHNGKLYVTSALRRLHQYGLIRQHIVRYDALHTHLQEVLLVMQPRALNEVRTAAPIIEIYEGRDVVLARALGDVALLKTVFRHDAIKACWLVDERSSPPASFRYDEVAGRA